MNLSHITEYLRFATLCCKFTGVGKSEFVERLNSLVIVLYLRKKKFIQVLGFEINKVSTHHLKYISNVGLGIFLR